MKTLSKTILSVLATGVISCGLLSQQAQALTSDSLLNLQTNGGTLAVGDKVFSNFSFVNTGLSSFNAAGIIVTASFVGGVYYLDYAGNMSLASATPGIADLLLNYTVTATAGQIVTIDQFYTGGADTIPPGGTGLALNITETARTGPLILGVSHLNLVDMSDPFAEAGDLLDINPPQTTLDVTKDIAFAITNATGGFVTVSDVQQSFHQTVPDGGSAVALLGIALAGIEGARRVLRARKA
jgi:hypothetical protein